MLSYEADWADRAKKKKRRKDTFFFWYLEKIEVARGQRPGPWPRTTLSFLTSKCFLTPTWLTGEEELQKIPCRLSRKRIRPWNRLPVVWYERFCETSTARLSGSRLLLQREEALLAIRPKKSQAIGTAWVLLTVQKVSKHCPNTVQTLSIPGPVRLFEREAMFRS